MKGKVLSKDGRLYVEYIAEGLEQDEVQKEQMMILYTDQHKTTVGEEVEFEVWDSYTISDEPRAKIL